MLRRKGVHTIILGYYDGIMVIYHSRGNPWNGGREERDWYMVVGALTTYIPSPNVQIHSHASEFLIEVTVVANSSVSKDVV